MGCYFSAELGEGGWPHLMPIVWIWMRSSWREDWRAVGVGEAHWQSDIWVGFELRTSNLEPRTSNGFKKPLGCFRYFVQVQTRKLLKKSRIRPGQARPSPSKTPYRVCTLFYLKYSFTRYNPRARARARRKNKRRPGCQTSKAGKWCFSLIRGWGTHMCSSQIIFILLMEIIFYLNCPVLNRFSF